MNYTSQLAVILLCSAIGWGWTPFEVSPTTNRQERPSVSGEVVVWQEYIQFEGQWDWEIYGVDLANDPTGLIVVASLDADQTRPSIWGTWVTWEDNFFGDLDVWVSDITRHRKCFALYHVAISKTTTKTTGRSRASTAIRSSGSMCMSMRKRRHPTGTSAPPTSPTRTNR